MSRVCQVTGKGPMGVDLLTRYTLTPDGDTTDLRIDGSFTGVLKDVAILLFSMAQSFFGALAPSDVSDHCQTIFSFQLHQLHVYFHGKCRTVLA